MNTTKSKFALPGLQLQNATRLTELTPFQRLLLISIADLCQKTSICFASEKHLLFRLGGERKNLERGIKKLSESEYINVTSKKFSNGKGFTTQKQIRLADKSLAIFRNKNFLIEPDETFLSPDETLKSFSSETPESHITHKEPLTQEPLNSFSTSSFEIASAISSDTKSVSEDNITSEEINSDIKKKSVFSELEQEFKGFAPEIDFELLAQRIIMIQELDGFAVSELLSNTEKVQQLLERTNIFLNGDFYKFNIILNEQVQKHILQNLLKMSSNN